MFRERNRNGPTVRIMSTMDRIEPQVVNTKLEDNFLKEKNFISIFMILIQSNFAFYFDLVYVIVPKINSRGYIFSGDPQE